MCQRTKVVSLLRFPTVTYTSSLGCVCCTTQIGSAIQVSVPLDNLLATEALLSQSETQILHLASSSLKISTTQAQAVYQSEERNYPPARMAWTKKSYLRTMAAADGSLGRSSEDQQNTAAAAAAMVAARPLWTLKHRLEILGLHWIITYISPTTSI